MRTLYDFERSGNCHKVRMMLAFLGLDYEKANIDLLGGDQNTPEFLAINPLHKVPVLDDGGFILRDSAAILIYLTQKYDGGAWYPDDAHTRGEIQQWLSFSVYDIANSFLLARALVIFKREGDLDGVEALSRNALQVLENHLKTREWLASDHVTIADIACYPYTALLEEGRLSLDSYPAVRQWIARVEALPGYEAMPGLPFGEKG